MFIINVALGNTSWRLLYKNSEKAEHDYLKIMFPAGTGATAFSIEDDFGQRMAAPYNSIHGVMLEDMDKTKMAHVEMALHQARTQSLATKMAQTDPGLKASAAMSPSVISPMNGFIPRQ